jgi:tetratricopeptide (TPR) repeat protein
MSRLAVLLLLLVVISPSPASADQGFAEVAKRADGARAAEHLEEAIELYRRGVKLRPGWADGWWWLGSLLYDQDRFPEATPAFRKFVSISAKSGPGYAFLALCEYETRDFDRSYEHFQEWARRGSPGDDALLDVAGFHWALLLTRQRRFMEALFLLTSKAQKLGDSPALTEALGLAALRIPSVPEDCPPAIRERVWLAGKAAFFSATGQVLRSKDYADRLLVRYDRDPNVHFFRGTLFSMQKELARATGEFEATLKLSANDAQAMTELALVKLEDFQASEALGLAQRAAELDPGSARTRYALGKAFFDSSKFSESLRELEAAKHLAPESAVIRFSLAKAYKALNREQEANVEFAAFQKLQRQQNAAAAEPSRSLESHLPREPKQ